MKSKNNMTGPLFLGMIFFLGCAEEAEKEDAVCGGNGELHGNHCHCDSGYSLSADGSTCEPSDDDNEVDYGGDFYFEPTEINASTQTGGNGQMWLLHAIEGDVHLKIEIYESFGGISSPGELIIDQVDTDYASCGTCLLVQTGCVEHGDHYDCDRIFMPSEGGVVRIDEIGSSAGDSLSGELLGVIFQEVSIGPNTQTQPVDGAEEIALAPWTFDAVLEGH